MDDDELVESVGFQYDDDDDDDDCGHSIVCFDSITELDNRTIRI